MDISARLERLPVSAFHYRLLLITGLGWAFDAMDTGIISFVLPVLAKVWGLSPDQMGFIGSIGLIGMAIGAVFAGTLADVFGRKKVFAGTLVLYSLATGLCGLAWNYQSLLLFRFLVGFGLGGQLPVAITLVGEYSPAGKRGRFLVLLESFWAVGWLLAALISYLIIPRFGWKIAFFMGAVPALYVFYIWRHVPESVRFLAQKNRLSEAHALLRSIEERCGLKPAEKAEFKAGETAKISFGEVWSGKMLRRTVCLWILWFCIVFSYYGIFIWLPSLMVKSGHTLIQTFEYVLIMTVAQLPGYFSAAYFVERIGRKATLSAYLALCAVCAYFFGQGGNPGVIILWGSLMSFFNLGAWGVVYTYTPEMYPTRYRAGGSGWAAGFGRVGGILAPMVVAKMLSGGAGDYQTVFAMFTGVLLLAAVNILVLGEETRGKELETI